MALPVAPLVAFFRNPLRVVKALYSGCGWAASVFAIGSVAMATRPSDLAGRLLDRQIDISLPFPADRQSAHWVLVVAVLALVILPAYAAITIGWEDFESAQSFVWRRAGPPTVTIWLAILVAVQCGPLTADDLNALSWRAVGTVWSWIAVPCIIVAVIVVAVHGLWWLTRFNEIGRRIAAGLALFWQAIVALGGGVIMMILAALMVAFLPIALTIGFVFLGSHRDHHASAPTNRDLSDPGR